MNYSKFMASRRPSLTQLRAVRRFLNNRERLIDKLRDKYPELDRAAALEIANNPMKYRPSTIQLSRVSTPKNFRAPSRDRRCEQNKRHNMIGYIADILLYHNIVNSREEALWQAEIEWDYEMCSRITGERN